MAGGGAGGHGQDLPPALSVGCGNATQEIGLLKAGLVEHFDLFEIARRMSMDARETADSENILPAIREYFPHAGIIPLGGIVSTLALRDILTNIPEDCGLLRDLLAIHDEANDKGLFHYAFCPTEKAWRYSLAGSRSKRAVAGGWRRTPA